MANGSPDDTKFATRLMKAQPLKTMPFAQISMLFARVAFLAMSAALFLSEPCVAQHDTLSAAVGAVLSQQSSNPALKRFYALRQNSPAWYGLDGLNSDGRAAQDAIASAPLDGLDPARYGLATTTWSQSEIDAAHIAYRDILLTGQLLRYISDLHRGRDELKRLDSDVDLPTNHFDDAGTLSQALTDRRLAVYLRALVPQDVQYEGLKSALRYYRALGASGGWAEFPAGPSFDTNSASEETLRLLQARLAFEDKLLANTTLPSKIDMDAAIRRFQTRNGLPSDGVVGTSTRSALNISVSARAAQIAANMERMRWLSHGSQRTYVEVNVADASLVLVDNGVEILKSRVIVGRPRTPTPIFQAEINDVEVNPPWNVPASIARNEIFPKLKKDPSYLTDHQMRIVDGSIQQQPGAQNALGYLKLNVTNRFRVYLHDTPSRSLFEREARFLSHGCIRVQEIKPLASYALTGTVTQGLDRLLDAIGTGQTVHLAVKKPIPLYVQYWTAIPTADGYPQFRPDIYGRDRRLIAAMSGSTFAKVNELTADCRRDG